MDQTGVETLKPLKFPDSIGPFRVNRSSGCSFLVKPGHDGMGNALDVAGDAVDDTLFHFETAFRDGIDGGDNLKLLVEIGGRKETDVDVDNHDRNVVPVDQASHYSFEIVYFTKVEKRYVNAVVEVTHHVDVVESELQREAVIERTDGFGDFGILRLRIFNF